jgi:hypothetical protein
MNLAEISFPVFKLKDTKPLVEDGLVYYKNESYNLDTAEEIVKIKVIDDQNLPQPTLGRRRLQLTEHKVKLHKIKTAVYFLGDLIKLAKANTWWIDNTGKLFQYKKSARAKLQCKKISKIFPLKGLGVVIELEGSHTRYKTIFRPKPEEVYAGVLESGKTSVLYGFYTQPFKTTWRKM